MTAYVSFSGFPSMRCRC